MKHGGRRTSLKATESGNVLFLILIAIALFGALSLAMTKNNQGSTKYVQDQRITTEISRFLTHVGIVRAAVHRMIGDGVTVATLSADEPAAAAYTIAPHEHKIYHLYGGGVQFVNNIGDASDIEINKNVIITDVGPSATAEVTLVSPIDTLRSCQEINMMLHGNTNIPEMTDVAYADLLGGNVVTLSDATTCSAAGGCDAVPFQCVVNASGAYAYYHVLYAQ